YGNLSSYMDSYFQFACSPQCMDGDSQWILGLCVAMNCPGTLVTSYVANKVGLKMTGVMSAILVNVSLFAAAWSMKVSVFGTTILMGVMVGLVQGITSVVVYQYVYGWAADRSSLFIATSVGASTLLSLVQNQVITFIVNPYNLKPDAIRGSRAFFSQPELLERVPAAVFSYAAITAGLQLVGYLLLARRSSALLPPLSFSNEPQEKEGEPDEVKQISLTPSQALKTPTFYAAFLFGIVTQYSLLLKANFYKQFALLFIPDDRFLTLVGTFIPVVAASSRMSVGAALSARLITIKTACILSLSVNSVLCAFWYIVPQVDAVLYMFLVLSLALVQSMFFVIAPVVTLQNFGPEHFSTIYGLLMFSFAVVGLISPAVIPRLIHFLGWFGLFASASLMCLVTLLVVVCTDFKP
ncbi:hypothetical protein EGW08_000614, partial [Elysia chlorotica]